ncbi:MAG: glycosyltransferase family 4 protein, partial [Deltaproteobacteria bacterium]|nr:glycosyltransferase family 4 protein [Deltaproteobacteria bacterium]MBN2687183.1 glycosyltransferase family 4 protein [Deltaproteobacteria bacterium]
MNSKSKKIAIAIPKYGLTGGAEHFAYELAERLSRNPHYEIHVFANKWQSGSQQITFHKIPIISFPKFLTTISFAFFTERKLSKMNFDVVHAHDRLFNADLFTMHGIPHRIWVHEIRRKSMSLFDYGTWWVEKSLVHSKQCRMFLAVSNVAKDAFIQEYNDVDPGKVHVVPPGVDAGRFQKADRNLCREEVRNRHGINDEDCVILFVSMNFDIKGLDRLIPGIAKLRKNNPGENIKLLVVGKGNEKKYGELARSHGIGDTVVFAGVVDRKRIGNYYAAADLFAMLSRFDTFGMV